MFAEAFASITPQDCVNYMKHAGYNHVKKILFVWKLSCSGANCLGGGGLHFERGTVLQLIAVTLQHCN